MSMNLVTTKPQSTALATTTTAANEWLEYGKSLTAKPYAGTLLSFKKGDWVLGIGQQAKEIMPGTKATAIVPSCKVGWHNFESGNSVFVLAIHRLKLPMRRALGDNDPATWVMDASGKERDPWQYTRTVSLVLEGNVLVTFSTTSAGGKTAIGEICKAYAEGIGDDKVGKLPVIELGFDSYQHSNRDYGKIKVPVFELVGWQDEYAALSILGGESGERRPAGDQALIESRPSRQPRATDLIDDDFPSNLGGPGPGDEEIPWA